VPLYLEEDVRETLPRFSGHDYGEWFEAAPGLRFRFRDAGHILGSAWIEAEIGSGPQTKRLVFTGDYGREHQPILRDPEPLSEADLYISESTYGNRLHPAHQDLDVELTAAVRRLGERGKGRLLIPAFAVGRTQNILYALARFYRDGRCPQIRIAVDSPLATLATRVVARHPECFDEEALRDFEAIQKDPCFRPHLTFTESREESIALNDDPRPTIVISASGMMESGRILHHLAHWISSPDAEILVVGFQAAYTLGRRILEGAQEVRILGVEHPVRARVTPMLGLSAHADRDGLLAALVPHAGRAAALFLVHGEDDQRKPLAAELTRRGYARVETPSDARNYRFE
jgi:metallo-beta-lactamase family protein